MDEISEPAQPRKRGRPRKSQPDNSASGPDTAVRPKGRPAKQPTSTPTVQTRTRGRPLKTAALAADASLLRQGLPLKDAVSGQHLPPASGTPAPKRRGRPPKTATPSANQPTKQTKGGNALDEFAEDNLGQPKSRKRGRPSYTQEPGAELPPVKRSRGRPRKSHVETNRKPLDQKVDAPPKKARGRPRKTDGVASTSANKPTTTRGKGRGRPRKNEVVPGTANKSTPTPAKRRGRPPKTVPSTVDISKDRESPNKESNTTIPGEPASGSPASSSNKRGRPRKSDTSTPVAESSSKAQSEVSVKTHSLLLTDIVGSYTLQCERVEAEWSDSADTERMEMSIVESADFPGGLMASFNLGILEGTMLLAADKTKLEDFRKFMSKVETPSEDINDTSSGCEHEPGLIDQEKQTPVTLGSERMVYFIWRGRNVGGDGEIHPDRGDDNRGYLEFNDTAAKFEGVASFPVLGPACHFTGTLADKNVSEVPESWSNFSEEEYEKARTARWG